MQSSINVTYRLPSGSDTVYMIARGVENLPITVGGVTLPTTARLNQQVRGGAGRGGWMWCACASTTQRRVAVQVVSGTFQPLQYVPLVNISAGNGAIFLWTLAFTAPNLNTLEGCLRLQTPASTPYPGLLIATGTEDAFDSRCGLFAVAQTHVHAPPSPFHPTALPPTTRAQLLLRCGQIPRPQQRLDARERVRQPRHPVRLPVLRRG